MRIPSVRHSPWVAGFRCLLMGSELAVTKVKPDPGVAATQLELKAGKPTACLRDPWTWAVMKWGSQIHGCACEGPKVRLLRTTKAHQCPQDFDTSCFAEMMKEEHSQSLPCWVYSSCSAFLTGKLKQLPIQHFCFCIWNSLTFPMVSTEGIESRRLGLKSKILQ